MLSRHKCKKRPRFTIQERPCEANVAHQQIAGNAQAEARVDQLMRENPNMTWGDAIIAARDEMIS